MTSSNLLLPILARCERPRAASLSPSKLQPGRLAQGPEEKQGFLGVCDGFIEWSATTSLSQSRQLISEPARSAVRSKPRQALSIFCRFLGAVDHKNVASVVDGLQLKTELLLHR